MRYVPAGKLNSKSKVAYGMEIDSNGTVVHD